MNSIKKGNAFIILYISFLPKKEPTVRIHAGLF